MTQVVTGLQAALRSPRSTFSIIQRKVLTPNDCASLDELIERIIAFGCDGCAY